MVKNRPKRITSWIVSILLAILGLLICFFASAYQFTGLLCIFLGLVIACYAGLRVLSQYRVTPAKVLRLILTTCVLLCIMASAVTGCLIGWASVGHSSVSCHYIVVLGAGVDGTSPSLSLQERLDAAYRYLVSNPQTICVVSGGQSSGEEISEAECMYLELVSKGINPDRIWMEDQASNTTENIRFSLDLIETRSGTRPSQIGLVSSEYHLYRAGLLAQKQGVIAVGIPAKTSLIPLRINYFLREIAAVWYYSLIGGNT